MEEDEPRAKKAPERREHANDRGPHISAASHCLGSWRATDPGKRYWNAVISRTTHSRSVPVNELECVDQTSAILGARKCVCAWMIATGLNWSWSAGDATAARSSIRFHNEFVLVDCTPSVGLDRIRNMIPERVEWRSCPLSSKLRSRKAPRGLSRLARQGLLV